MVKAVNLMIVGLILCVTVPMLNAVRPQYQHFEDYLNSLDTNDQSWISDNKNSDTLEPEEESDDDDDIFDDATTTPSTTTEASTTTTSPLSQHQTKEITCCLLGQMAGDKGFHCFVQYYAARLILRNRNRAHNRKMNFYGRDRIPQYGEKVMRTFEQCVAGMGTIFHKCCHLASMESRPRPRYDTVQRASYYQRRHQRREHHNSSDVN